MRAKRSKKYRKLMHQYEVAFGFREPYQVLVDSHFLRAVHSFKMDLGPYLERTVQGQVKPFITKCSLASVMSSSKSKPDSRVRPPHLPPPTVLPLRYCSHNEDDTPIDEASCLLSLLSPSTEAKKNKEHYILATADPALPTTEGTSGSGQQKKKSSVTPRQPRYNLRRDARTIPGVPIIYVKRSVMILEPMSGTSENVREGVERGKLKTGVSSGTGKRKREETDGQPSAGKIAKKVKGPNPLSVKKPKKREQQPEGSKFGDGDHSSASKERTAESHDSGEQKMKTKRKRRHKTHHAPGGQSHPDASTGVES